MCFIIDIKSTLDVTLWLIEIPRMLPIWKIMGRVVFDTVST